MWGCIPTKRSYVWLFSHLAGWCSFWSPLWQSFLDDVWVRAGLWNLSIWLLESKVNQFHKCINLKWFHWHKILPVHGFQMILTSKHPIIANSVKYFASQNILFKSARQGFNKYLNDLTPYSSENSLLFQKMKEGCGTKTNKCNHHDMKKHPLMSLFMCFLYSWRWEFGKYDSLDFPFAFISIFPVRAISLLPLSVCSCPTTTASAPLK